MKSRIVAATSLAIVACLGVSTAQEEDIDVRAVIEGRQSALRDIGAAFKAINDEFKKSAPSLGIVRQYARQIDDMSKGQKFWFPAGTGPDTDIEMKAKADIWEKPAEFKAGQAAFAEHAAKLAKVAEGSDVGAIRSQVQALGKTCKSCHDKFREEDD